MKRLFVISFLAVGFWTCLPRCTEASALRIALRPDVSISGDVILLAHLLAAPFPAELQKAAAKISLGSTPAFGTVREISQSALKAALEDAGMEPADFAIPNLITVRRLSRPLTKSEITAAVESYLAAQNVAIDRQAISRDLLVPGDLSVPDADLGLYVKRAQFDAALHRSRLSMASRSFPQLNAFELDLNDYLHKSKTATRQTEAAASRKVPALVHAGVPTQMVVNAADTHMVLEVLPSKEGRNGEVIRVRIANTAKFLKAKVTGPNLLEASY